MVTSTSQDSQKHLRESDINDNDDGNYQTTNISPDGNYNNFTNIAPAIQVIFDLLMTKILPELQPYLIPQSDIVILSTPIGTG